MIRNTENNIHYERPCRYYCWEVVIDREVFVVEGVVVVIDRELVEVYRVVVVVDGVRSKIKEYKSFT